MDNYEKTKLESFLMPSSGLKVVERIPHNHLFAEDESKLKSEVEDSLKFINIAGHSSIYSHAKNQIYLMAKALINLKIL